MPRHERKEACKQLLMAARRHQRQFLAVAEMFDGSLARCKPYVALYPNR